MMRRVRRTEVVVVPLLGKEMTAPTLSPLALEATSVTMAASALILDVLACRPSRTLMQVPRIHFTKLANTLQRRTLDR